MEQHHSKKFIILLFLITLITTAFMAAFVMAYNHDLDKDTDNDGLTDYEEKTIYQTFWYDADTDKDGYNDGEEVENGYSPKHPKIKMVDADTDNDGLNDEWEIKLGTNLMIRDSDGDGYLDGTEVHHGYSPTNPKPFKVDKNIKINIADFNLKYYHDNILLEELSVSTGKPGTPTPRGEFTIIEKVPIMWYIGYPNTKYNLHFTTGANRLRYFIHTAWWHDLFGKENVSGGCVNVRQDIMKRLYEWADTETKVVIE